MKIRCLKSDLVKGVSIVSKAVPTKTTGMHSDRCNYRYYQTYSERYGAWDRDCDQRADR